MIFKAIADDNFQAVGQFCAKANILQNLAVVEGLVKTAAASDAKVLTTKTWSS